MISRNLPRLSYFSQSAGQLRSAAFDVILYLPPSLGAEVLRPDCLATIQAFCRGLPLPQRSLAPSLEVLWMDCVTSTTKLTE